jgi:putative protein kinase ArgK-like GTPase of G3E family
MTNSKVDTFPAAILDLVQRAEGLLSRQASDPGQRMLVALAGVPGAGKSTVSEALLTELAARGVKDVVVVPMVRPYSIQFAPMLPNVFRMASITQGKCCRPLITLIRHSEGVVLHSRLMRRDA